MNKKVLSRIITVSGIAVGAFCMGTLCERRHLQKTFYESSDHLLQTTDNCWKEIRNKPALPVFGTVSAAVPTSDTEEINLTATPSRVAQIMRYGFPSLDHVRSYSDHVLSYDRRNRVPNWVFEHLTADSGAKNEAVDRARCEFRADDSIHPYFRAGNMDYRRSGFDRGHMAAAANHRKHQKHCDDTFLLSNTAPQVGPGFNRDAWNRLEIHVRSLTAIYPNVYVCTGPLYLPYKETDGKMYVKYQVIGSNTVAVPTHFYKVIVGETANKDLEMEAYVMPNKAINDETPLQVFQVPPETIERSAGLLFFDKIDRKHLVKINGKKI